MSCLSASSLADSGETSHSSSLARASSRAHTEPMAPVAPITIVRARHPALVVDLGEPEPLHRVVGRPQRPRGAVAVAGGDRQRRLLGHGHAGVADHLGEGAQPHHLGAELLGRLGRGEQPGVGELRAVRHQLLRRPADRDQPALGLGAGGRLDAGDVAVDERRRVGHRLLHDVGDAPPGEWLAMVPSGSTLLEVLLRQRVDDEGEPALASRTVGEQQPRLQTGRDDHVQQVVVGQAARRWTRWPASAPRGRPW